MKQELVGSSDACLTLQSGVKALGNPLRLRRGGCQKEKFLEEKNQLFEKIKNSFSKNLSKKAALYET